MNDEIKIEKKEALDRLAYVGIKNVRIETDVYGTRVLFECPMHREHDISTLGYSYYGYEKTYSYELSKDYNKVNEFYQDVLNTSRKYCIQGIIKKFNDVSEELSKYLKYE